MNQEQEGSGVVESCNQPNYAAVDLPSADRSEYTYVERRAELLEMAREAGGPGALNQTRLAEQFDVSQQQISKDLDRLAEYVHAEVTDRARRAFKTILTVDRAIQGMMDDGEHRKAAKTAMERDEWLTEFHDMTTMKERLDDLEAAQGREKEERDA